MKYAAPADRRFRKPTNVRRPAGASTKLAVTQFLGVAVKVGCSEKLLTLVLQSLLPSSDGVGPNLNPEP